MIGIHLKIYPSNGALESRQNSDREPCHGAIIESINREICQRFGITKQGPTPRLFAHHLAER
jgi:hypothetical protein